MEQTDNIARILVVEDESIVALDMQSRLSAMAYDVVGIAATGEEAIDLAQRTVPDLILMDVQLQGDMDGVDAAERIHRTNDIPVIFVTAFADELTLARAKVTHAFGYILKPFQEREVQISIEMALYKHRLERDLRVSREWLNGTIHAISDGIVALDQDERIIFMNSAAEALFGVADRDARGLGIGEFCAFMPNDMLSGLKNRPDAEERDARWMMMSTRSSRIPVELIRTTIRGSNSDNAGHVLSIRDISETITSVAAKTRLAAIASNSYDAILSIDPSLTILSWNLGAERSYGFTESEMIGKNVQDLAVDGAARDRFRKAVEVVLAGGDAGTIETLRRSRSGKLISVAVSLSPLRDAEGNAVEIACIERDVSAEKEYEESLILAKRNAEESSRVKSEFLSNMSHELRTPLNSIMGMIDLSRDLSVSDEQREYLEVARQSAENLLFLINSILDFSKIEAGKMRIQSLPFDPVEAVEDSLEELSVQAHRKGLALLFRAQPGIPKQVEGDPRRFKQIVTNLLSNAIKFTEIGGVRVELRFDASGDGDSRRFELSVKDSGIGIDAERQTAIWETFTQLDGSSTRAYGGTGLGLSIVKSLAELMGGTIRLESEPGKGSTFSVSLPFRTAPAVGLGADVPPVLAGLAVSVVVADEEERVILTELLSSWGCSVRSLAGLADILGEAAPASGPERRVLIVDEKLPDRRSLFSRVEKAEPGSFRIDSLIVLSNIGAKDEHGWRALSDSARFLFKPIRRSALLDCLSVSYSRGEAAPAAPSFRAPGRAEPERGDEPGGRDRSEAREQRLRAELASDGSVLPSLERFLQEAEAVDRLPGERLEQAAARCRRELEATHTTVLPQYLFKVMLACRRTDASAVAAELDHIRAAVELGARNGAID
jgi:two-component system sensor histidine kinase/response regulator